MNRKKADYDRPEVVIYTMNADVICASTQDNFVDDQDWGTEGEVFI